ncbi:MAG: hypothetical protein OHK93_001710 [Ramalina farinacea]|uniref:Uncharacterized protein n=1 Tax=Ramalina farinacea TaxID=258253 RepID=A0AA43QPY7_9LECA|nr:hypothetical protein [Ramalina farinacea]
MKIPFYSLIATIVTGVAALPPGPGSPHHLHRRDVCGGGPAALPILYHPYGTDVCPPIIHLNADGTCPSTFSGYDIHLCTSFCQLSTTFTYITESPFTENPFCHGPQSCTITNTVTTTVTWSANAGIKIDPPKLYGVQFGVTGGFSYASARATAEARSFSVKLDQNQCGYFTFIPIIRTICGVFTQGVPPREFHDTQCIITGDKTSTDPNFCVSQPQNYPDGKASGDVVFVYTDCGTREPLPKEQQDPAYQHDGVPLPRAQLMGILKQLPGGQATQTSQAYAHAPTTSSAPPPLGTGGLQLGSGNAGKVDSAKYKRV